MPNVYLIGGPNGAGKTTAAFSVFPEKIKCIEFVNADLIAQALSPFNYENVAIQAGKIMLDRIKELIKSRSEFAFESTLASKGFAKVLKDCKNTGYTTNLLYMALPSVELAINRVKYRVLNGGHDIPEDVIRRRYIRSINNLFDLYLPMSDNAYIYDCSGVIPLICAAKENNGALEIIDEQFITNLRGK